MKKRSKAILIIWVLLLGAVLWFQVKILFFEGTKEERTGFQVGEKMRDFTLRSLEGKEYQLSELVKTNPVLLIFFSLYSGPALMEISEFNDYLSREKNPDFQAVLISNEEPSKLQSWRERSGIQMPILVDSKGKVMSLYRVESVPANFLIDQEMKLVFSKIGTEGFNVFRVKGLLKFQAPQLEIPELPDSGPALQEGGTTKK